MRREIFFYGFSRSKAYFMRSVENKEKILHIISQEDALLRK